MPAVSDVEADNVLLRLLLTPEGRADPYPLYRELRETVPVLRSSVGPIVVSRHEDCLTALRDPRLGRGTALRASGEGPSLGFAGFDVDPQQRQEFFERAGNNMLFADPPDHTRLRRLVSRAFTPHRIEGLRPAVESMVGGYLDDMLDAGEVDVMTALAFPLPATVIGELVGVPAGDRAAFQPLVRAGSAALDPAADRATLQAASAAMGEMRAYFFDLVAERRRAPADDLLSGLVAAREAGDALSDDEVVATAILLFAAGFETTTNLIGNGLLALLNHPDQMTRWRRRPIAGSHRRRGAAALGQPRAAQPPRRARADRRIRRTTGTGRCGPGPARGSEPRPGAVRPTRVLRRRPGRQHPAQLRLGNPPLPRSCPGPHGRRGGVQRTTAPLPQHRKPGR